MTWFLHHTKLLLHIYSLLWILYSQCSTISMSWSMWLKQSIEFLHLLAFTICPWYHDETLTTNINNRNILNKHLQHFQPPDTAASNPNYSQTGHQWWERHLCQVAGNTVWSHITQVLVWQLRNLLYTCCYVSCFIVFFDARCVQDGIVFWTEIELVDYYWQQSLISPNCAITNLSIIYFNSRNGILD